MVPGKGVRYREVYAIKDVRHREVPLYSKIRKNTLKIIVKGGSDNERDFRLSLINIMVYKNGKD